MNPIVSSQGSSMSLLHTFSQNSHIHLTSTGQTSPMGNNHPNFRIHLDIVVCLHKPPHPQQQHTELAPIVVHSIHICLSHFTFMSMENRSIVLSLSLCLCHSLSLSFPSSAFSSDSTSSCSLHSYGNCLVEALLSVLSGLAGS